MSSLIAPLAISQLMLLGLLLLLNYKGLLPRLLAFFCLCVVAYILVTMDVFDGNFAISFLLGRLATLSPFVLWLIAYLLFVDEGKIKPAIWLTILLFFLARSIGQFVGTISPESATSSLFFVTTQLLPQLVMLGFSVHAILLGFQGYSDDLIEKRRQFRVLFVLCMGAVVVAVLGVGTVSGLQNFFSISVIAALNEFPTEVFNFYLFAVTLLLNLQAFTLSDEALSLIPESTAQAVTEDSTNGSTHQVDPAIVMELERLMAEEKLFSQTGLTIANLAERLALQEYKLRRLINQSMGYRNFNQFLNNYRIEDASLQLRNTSDPISNIALDVGYSSLSVFNKAFKDRFEMTPSEYRQSHLQSDVAVQKNRKLDIGQEVPAS